MLLTNPSIQIDKTKTRVSQFALSASHSNFKKFLKIWQIIRKQAITSD